jgi:hypothetical protein
MLWSIKEINEGSSITVQYTPDRSYFMGKCGCASCRPDNPPVVHRRAVQEQVSHSEGVKKKGHRAGRRKRKIREREAKDLDRELEELDRALDELP